MAKNYIDQAAYKLKQVEGAIDDEKWPIAVRQSQECVEQSIVEGGFALRGDRASQMARRGGDSAGKKTGFPIGLLKRWRF